MADKPEPVTVRAVASFVHNGRLMKSGEPITTTPGEAADLIAMGFAAYAEGPVPAAPRDKYSRRDMRAKA